MNKLKIYLDTSVISCLEQKNKPDDRKDCEKLFAKIRAGEYDVYVSDVTRNELENCQEPLKTLLLKHLESTAYSLIEDDGEITELAKAFIAAGVLKPTSYDDSVHIASAVVAKCDVVVSLNFRHIVNPETSRGVRSDGG
ncbi:hypothetical protein FACS1894187_16680 [Synergistales bacterium]|nr:hypothetical protein FACS1894187_16680 [Synergistales bacterium]